MKSLGKNSKKEKRTWYYNRTAFQTVRHTDRYHQQDSEWRGQNLRYATLKALNDVLLEYRFRYRWNQRDRCRPIVSSDKKQGEIIWTTTMPSRTTFEAELIDDLIFWKRPALYIRTYQRTINGHRFYIRQKKKCKKGLQRHDVSSTAITAR